MLLLSLVKGPISSGDELWAFNRSVQIIDDYIIIASALGCLITGILFSIFTNWGFFKHRWITVKYVITIFTILVGTFFLGPWVNGIEAISFSAREFALYDPIYMHYVKMINYFGPVQAVILTAALFISVFKPWGKSR